MRPLAAALASLALLLAACSSPCEDLGSELCRCTRPGTTRDTCERQVKQELDRLNPGQDVEDLCTARLDTCSAPQDVSFCDWLQSRCGMASCGLSAEDRETACAAP
jgi:hypothetical protein